MRLIYSLLCATWDEQDIFKERLNIAILQMNEIKRAKQELQNWREIFRRNSF